MLSLLLSLLRLGRVCQYNTWLSRTVTFAAGIGGDDTGILQQLPRSQALPVFG
jgi:hypothetical protein